jgi:Holliday junction resolvase RusA-like endonuclease
MIEFRLSCIPPKTSHHAKRIVKRGKFSSLADKPELVAAKQTLDSLLLPHQIDEPVRGPVSLRLVFYWPWLASHPKRTRALGRIPHTSRPDCSNLAKTLEDRLVALRFIEDDNAVVHLQIMKFWGDRPGIHVRIEPATRLSALFTDSPV